jgi:hypothetical protein
VTIAWTEQPLRQRAVRGNARSNPFKATLDRFPEFPDGLGPASRPTAGESKWRVLKTFPEAPPDGAEAISKFHITPISEDSSDLMFKLNALIPDSPDRQPIWVRSSTE